jgi:hypothetical protein
VELQPPFAYLRDLYSEIRDDSRGDNKTKTSDLVATGQCSSSVSLGDPSNIQSEPLDDFLPYSTDDVVQFLELISFPQQTALEHLLTDEQ